MKMPSNWFDHIMELEYLMGLS